MDTVVIHFESRAQNVMTLAPKPLGRGRRPAANVLVVVLGCLVFSLGGRAQERSIDVSHSTMTVRVFKSGLFSLFAHNHEIQAPLTEGRVNLSAPLSVTLKFDARKLRVLDPDLSEKDRAEVQRTMDGPDVLDSSRFPEILFQSTKVEQQKNDRWIVHGNLTLHGETHPITLPVNRDEGRYRGSTKLSQRAFGITPVSIAGGTIKVKDAVEIAFDIALEP